MNLKAKPVMRPAEKIVKDYIQCPHCGEATTREFTSETATQNRYWEYRHRECGGSFMYGYVNGTGVVGAIVGEPEETPIKSLMMIPPQKEPVYFVIGNSTYSRDEDGTPDLDRDYYYNEHSCPTNWMENITAIIIGDDGDPHGLIEHVRSMPTAEYQRIRDEVRVSRGYGPDATDGSSDGDCDFACVAAAFPEVTRPLQDDVIEMEDTGPKPTPEWAQLLSDAAAVARGQKPDVRLVGRGLITPIIYGLPGPKKEGE